MVPSVEMVSHTFGERGASALAPPMKVSGATVKSKVKPAAHDAKVLAALAD